MATAARTAKTAPVETAPVESPAAEASRVAPMDFSALKPVTVARPERSVGAGRKTQDLSVFKGWLNESWDARKTGEDLGEGRGFVVPTEQVKVLKNKLNQAATALKLGVSFGVSTKDPSTGKALADGQSFVSFVAKVRTPRKSKKAAAEATQSTETTNA